MNNGWITVPVAANSGDTNLHLNPRHVSYFLAADDGSTTAVQMLDGSELTLQGDQTELLLAQPIDAGIVGPPGPQGPAGLRG